MASFDFSFQTATLNGLNIGADTVIPSTLGDETRDRTTKRSPISKAGDPNADVHKHANKHIDSLIDTHSPSPKGNVRVFLLNFCSINNPERFDGESNRRHPVSALVTNKKIGSEQCFCLAHENTHWGEMQEGSHAPKYFYLSSNCRITSFFRSFRGKCLSLRTLF